MSTLKEVLLVGAKVRQGMHFFGGEPEFVQEFKRRVVELGTAIAKEQNLPPQAAKNLPPETELGTDSQLLFDDLKTWLRANNVLDLQ